MFCTYNRLHSGFHMKMLNPNKGYGHGSISILMLKICGSTICRPVEMAFKEAQITGLFPTNGKKETSLLSIRKVIN